MQAKIRDKDIKKDPWLEELVVTSAQASPFGALCNVSYSYIKQQFAPCQFAPFYALLTPALTIMFLDLKHKSSFHGHSVHLAIKGQG